jgi:hypothetical protein
LLAALLGPLVAVFDADKTAPLPADAQSAHNSQVLELLEAVVLVPDNLIGGVSAP